MARKKTPAVSLTTKYLGDLVFPALPAKSVTEDGTLSEKERSFHTLHYQILLLLLSLSQATDPRDRTLTAKQIADTLNVKPQNVTEPIRDLSDLGYIGVARTEGRNKFLWAVIEKTQL